MSTPSKDKGDRAERALVTYLQAWWPNVRRTKAGGEKDLGDLSGLIDRDGDEWCVQVADRKILLAQHGAVIVKAREAAQQAERLGAPLWCMVVKRAGCTDPADWFVWLSAGSLFDLVGGFNDGHRERGTWRSFAWSSTADDLACLTVRTWVALTAPEPF